MDRLIPSSVTLQDDLAASEPLRLARDVEMLPPPRHRRNLYFAAFCANISSVSAGCAMAWSSPSIENMKNGGLIDDNQGSWLTSILALGAAVGPFLSYRLVDKIGRKPTILLDMVLFIVAWLLLGFAKPISANLPGNIALSPIGVMYISRFLSGVSCGCIFMVTPMYIAEISDMHVRSSLGSLMQMFLSVGFLIEYCVGPYFSAPVLTAASTIPPVICAILFLLFLPESPLYLLSQRDTQGATRALVWLRQQDDVYLETLEIQKSLEEVRSTDVVSWIGLLSKQGHIKCLSIGLALVFFQQLSGINVVLFYSESIFSLTTSVISGPLCTIVTGFVFMFAASFAPILTKKFGMKKMLVMSSLTAVIFQGVLSSYFYLSDGGVNVKLFHWVPITCIILYLITFSIGLGPLPWAVMAEIYAPPIKAKAFAISSSTCWVFTFLLTKFFPLVTNDLGPGACFAVFSAFCVVSTIYTRFILPDTKGLSLSQIQRMMYGVRQVV